MDKGLTVPGADSSVKNTPNAAEFICSICLPKPNTFATGHILSKSRQKRLPTGFGNTIKVHIF